MTASGRSGAVESAAALLGPLAVRDEPIGARTTYRAGGSAALFVEVLDRAGLAQLQRAVGASGVEVLVVGNGSNLLVAEAGFPGLAVVLGGEFDGVELEGDTVLAGGATPLPVLARRSAAAGLVGLEWYVGIPGTVGGAVAMNAGGHGSETAACLVEVEIASLAEGSVRVVGPDDLDLSYRHSNLAPTDLVLRARFAATRGDPAAAASTIDEIVRWRRANQPGGRNAGSVFTNPPGDSAGRLIESCGLKGLRVGHASVSTKHANFIQLEVGGRSDDVAALIATVVKRVRQATGVELKTEVRMIGFSS